ncbi:sodium:proton antiporter NhaD [Desulfuromonas acetoxidans]|uniref:Na+/H+ antiporter (NhaD family) n=1 Tax=Desulfuromonas acetoxidans (strain DSM 684 / 11070) TaxID=281689 RepID=Q1JZV8_DESA6|nr:sodium:proton antiporter NhaD [Desulfuromonas acetoxidans]EAT15784.1 Na+/H+ antiporter (NhaD family) [Desulfuromonas acetoxidans DSM 684]MBF0645014.1 sodium:proton antiporter NhaD [Desulfuromonas acetoxidans]NVD25670.1 sodium:proton antiporter NhaD [Desulfuromonas acetoxidans]NVE17723.1 sodium:proton antiporter NhaD [Desulfuromonas acetoxidans]
MKSFLTLMFCLIALPAMANEGGGAVHDLTTTPLGIIALILFVAAYMLVILEEKLHLRKSKPVLMAAGIIWVLVAITFNALGEPTAAHEAIAHNLLEYGELFLFLLVAMTYINAMEERNVFQALRSWLVSRGFSLRVVFWITGLLAFFISPIADNLTTALLMGAVVMAVGGSNQRFVVMACINVVVGANAGGAFSPFGDITTLMVWQKGIVQFGQFFVLFVPALVNWLVPAFIMNFMISKEKPEAADEAVVMKFGAKRIMVLFLMTIVTAVSFHNFLDLPPAAGMMLGLSYLGLFSYFIKRHEQFAENVDPALDLSVVSSEGEHEGFDLFRKIARAEWDTLLFFYGVIMCVGGLSQFGYLASASQFMYHDLGAFNANVLVGILSAIVDNIPVMFAVLTMEPHMSHGQWLLVTMTAGVGGSLLSIGSAAGVGLMGTARGIYTFGRHLVYTPIVALGYAASIAVHMLINAKYF